MNFLNETQCFIATIPSAGWDLIAAIFILFFFIVVLLVFTKIIGFVIQPPQNNTSDNKNKTIIPFQKYNYRDNALFFATILLGIIAGVLGSMWITYAPDVIQVDKPFLFWTSLIGFWILIIGMAIIYGFYYFKAINAK